MYLERMSCCGMAEWDGLEETGRESMLEFGYSDCFDDFVGKFIVITDTVSRGWDLPLVSYIRRHKLGSVRKAGENRNPNSDNIIRVWVWDVDKRATEKHLQKITSENKW